MAVFFGPVAVSGRRQEVERFRGLLVLPAVHPVKVSPELGRLVHRQHRQRRNLRVRVRGEFLRSFNQRHKESPNEESPDEKSPKSPQLKKI